MKRFFSGILCLVTAFACAASLAGCGRAGSAEAEAEAKKVVTGFMDAIVDLDIETAKGYADNTTAVSAEIIDSFDMDDLLEDAMEENREIAAYADKIRPMFDTLIEKVKSVMSYEIVGSRQIGKNYVFDVKLTSVDEDKTKDIEDVLEKSVRQYFMDDAMASLGEKLFASGRITEQSTESDIIGAVFEELMPELNKAIESLEIATTDVNAKVVVSEKDGKWLVNTAESDFD